jgi:hypothetical protein
MIIGIPSQCPICESPQHEQVKSIIHCQCGSTGVMDSYFIACWFTPEETPKAKFDIEKARNYQNNVVRQERIKRIMAWNKAYAIF